MATSRTRAIAKMGWISVAANTILFGLKFWVGSSVGSVAIVADAWHTFSDSLSSIVAITGARTARRPADESHPFGHGRAELISAVLIGALLGSVAFNIIIEALTHLRGSEPVQYGRVALIVTSVSVAVKELLAQGSFLVARRTKSAAMKADGWHHRSDAITSLLVIVGIAIGSRFWWLDSALGMVVALFLIREAVRVIREAALPLLGEKPTTDLLAKLHDVADRSNPCVQDVHHVHVHRYGDHVELTCHVRVPGEVTVRSAHRSVTEFESLLRDELGVEPTVHMESGE